MKILPPGISGTHFYLKTTQSVNSADETQTRSIEKRTLKGSFRSPGGFGPSLTRRAQEPTLATTVRAFTLIVLVPSLSYVCCLSVPARADEARAAIAPVPVGQGAPAALQRAFQDELPRALAEAGFSLKPPNEVDMQIGERPEFLRCAGGGCLVEEAAFLRVGLLVLPRFEPAPDRDGYSLGLSLFDAGEKRSIADAVDRCTGNCTTDRLRASLRGLARRLRSASQKPGELEVSSEPAAQLTIDGRASGTTPWRGELPAGHHVVTLEASGARVERDVTVQPTLTARVSVKLDVVPPPVSPTAHGRFHIVKWVALAAGIAAAGVGGGLSAIDGNPTCTLAGAQKQCPRVYDTLPVGAALIGVGGALVITSVIMLAIDKPAAPKAAAALVPSRDGASVVVEGRF
jgi:hypothetical protein